MAKSISAALVGSAAFLLYYSQGMHPWVGLLAWAIFMEAGEDAAAFKRTIAGTTFGACLGWIAIMTAVQVPVPAEGGWWILRQAITVTATLFVLVLATRFDLLSRAAISLVGYAVFFAVDSTITLTDMSVSELLTAPRLSNPLINSVISMVGGALLGLAAKRFGDAMTAGKAG